MMLKISGREVVQNATLVNSRVIRQKAELADSAVTQRWGGAQYKWQEWKYKKHVCLLNL